MQTSPKLLHYGVTLHVVEGWPRGTEFVLLSLPGTRVLDCVVFCSGGSSVLSHLWGVDERACFAAYSRVMCESLKHSKMLQHPEKYDMRSRRSRCAYFVVLRRRGGSAAAFADGVWCSCPLVKVWSEQAVQQLMATTRFQVVKREE